MLSQTIIDHFYNPRNSGVLASATHKGIAGTPGDGPYVVLYFIVADDRIVKATYETYGCPVVVTCASLVAELFTGKTVEQALKVDSNDLILLSGGIPEGKAYCPQLAVDALNNAFAKEINQDA